MALAYNVQRTTGDLDGVFEPKSRVYELARAVAEESGLDLPPDWLNDGVKGFLPGQDVEAKGVLLDAVGISVSVASPRYLFVLKAMAARESDEDDLRVLYPLCELGGFAADMTAWTGNDARMLEFSATEWAAAKQAGERVVDDIIRDEMTIVGGLPRGGAAGADKRVRRRDTQGTPGKGDAVPRGRRDRRSVR